MSFTKMVLVPAESQTGGNEPENIVVERPKRIERNPEKIQRLLKIALKIASLDAYDEDFKIKDSKGNPIDDSDIIALLNNAISSQKILVGENDFIRLMYDSHVDPNWIVNENMRSKLLNYRPPKTYSRTYPKTLYSHQNSPQNSPQSTPPSSPTHQTDQRDLTYQPDITEKPLPKKARRTLPKQTQPTNQSVDSQSRMGNSTSKKRENEEEPIKERKKQKQVEAWEVPLPEDDDDL